MRRDVRSSPKSGHCQRFYALVMCRSLVCAKCCDALTGSAQNRAGLLFARTTSQPLRIHKSMAQLSARQLDFFWRYQMYIAASAITTIVTITIAAICTQTLLAKPLLRVI